MRHRFITLALALLPVYWFLWKYMPLSMKVGLRATATVIIAVVVWYGFIVGPILNDLRGLGT